MNEDIKKLGNYLAKKIDDSKNEILERIDTRFNELNTALAMPEDEDVSEDDLDEELEEEDAEEDSEEEDEDAYLKSDDEVTEIEGDVMPRQKQKLGPAPKPPRPPKAITETEEEVDDFFSDAIPKKQYEGSRKVNTALPDTKSGKEGAKNDGRKEKPAKKGMFGFGKAKEEPKKQEGEWF